MKVNAIITVLEADRTVYAVGDLYDTHIAEPGIYRIAFTTDPHMHDRFVVLGDSIASRVVIYVPREKYGSQYASGMVRSAWPGAQFIRCDAGEVVSLTFTQE